MLLLEGGAQGLYIPEIMSTYRVHFGGIWSLKATKYRIKAASITNSYIVKRYGSRFSKEIKKRELSNSISLIYSLLEDKEFFLSLKYYLIFLFNMHFDRGSISFIFKFMYHFTFKFFIFNSNKIIKPNSININSF